MDVHRFRFKWTKTNNNMLFQNILILTATFLLAMIQLGSMEARVPTKVRLHPDVTFGAIQVLDRDTYHLVCADGFDDHAARAVCRSQGFAFGKSICCSAFGRMDYSIGYTHIKCGGIESDLLDCEYVKYFPNCASGDYAAVACSNIPANEEYKLTIEPSGKITISHFESSGYICANGFGEAEATVICRKKGFKGGYAYFQTKHTAYNTVQRLGVPWLSSIACHGTESNLRECASGEWGSVGACDVNKIPAVYCYNETGFAFTLEQGTTKDNGLVVFTVDGKAGAICLRDSDIEYRRSLAAIVCKQLGYKHGSLLNDTDDFLALMVRASERFPGPSSDMFITKVECKGNESSLAECVFRIVENDSRTPAEFWHSKPACNLPVVDFRGGLASSNCDQASSQFQRWRRNELDCWQGSQRLAVKCVI